MTRSGRRGALAYLDASGASVSTLCAIHCALMPMMATLLPVVGLGILAGERTEIVLVALSVSLGITGLYLGYRVHRSRRALFTLAIGLCLLASGRVAEGREFERVGMTLVVGGGLVVAASHLLNRHLCRSPREGRGLPVIPGDDSHLPLESGATR